MEKVGEDGSITLNENKPVMKLIKGYTYFKDDDVLLAKITPCFENGKGCLVKNTTNNIGFGSTEFHVLRPKEINKKVLFYITKLDAFMKVGEKEMRGSAGQKRVPEEFIKNFKLGLPSLSEQEKIAKFLDIETAKIDSLKEKLSQELELLKEYKTSLITSVVTGQIDVREYKDN